METMMISEIKEQPDVMSKTLRYLESLKPAVTNLFANNDRKIIFIARGTSDNVANYGIFAFPSVLGCEAYSLSPSLLNNYDAKIDLSGSIVIAISQSGETNEIVSATAKAKQLGAKVIAITNNSNSSLAGISDLSIATPAGKEEAVPATKSYTAALLVVAWMVANLANSEDLKSKIANVPALLIRQVKDLEIPEPVITLVAKSETAVFAGRGFAMGAAYEAALKLKETCGINATGLSVADLVHGPIAALSPEVPLVVMSGDSDSEIYPGIVDLMERAKGLSAPIITIGDFKPEHKSSLHIEGGLGSGYEFLAPLVLAVPSQLLANFVSLARGLNPDNPVGLKKITATA